MRALFPTGRLVGTQGAQDALLANPSVSAFGLLQRHATGDFGEMCTEDCKVNRDAIQAKIGQIMSAYTLPDGTRIWIITESDRSVTTILLPEEY